MTLDPVHVDGIAALAGQIDSTVEDEDHENLAERVWNDFLDPLRTDGHTILEPVSDQYRRRVEIDSVALIDSPYPTTHGLDSGTLNPTTYRNGAVVDVAHATMASDPSDHDLHRARSIVGSVHLNDERTAIPSGWQSFDDGYCRRMWIRAPRVQRFAEGVVHSLALYQAEISHAHTFLHEVEDILLLDGPMYPKELLRWEDRHQELRECLITESLPREIVTAYVELIQACRDQGLPILGFVKNPSSNRITRALRASHLPAPWFNDASFFRLVLDDDDRGQDELSYTNWFHSRGGTDRTFHDGGVLQLDVPDGVGVTFMAIFDPRDRIIYRAEAPAWLTEDPDHREQITMLLLREVAGERGPPRAIQKADRIARISHGERRSLRNVFASAWASEVDQTYDDLRWGLQ